MATQINDNAAPSVQQPLAGDLLETSVASFTGENAGCLVRNGTFTDVASGNTAGSFPATIWDNFTNPASNVTTTYDLDLSVNTFGYDITAVQVYSAWNNNRAGQNYQIFYALVSAPATFLTLGANVLASASNASVITRTVDSVAGTSFVSGVSSIRFVHATNGALGAILGSGTVYRELDIVGFAAVPEPATSVLGLCASLLLFRRRRA